MYRVLQWLEVKHIKWICIVRHFYIPLHTTIDTIVVRHALNGKVERPIS